MNTINYLDTDDSSGLIGHFIGTVKTSWWSTPMAETNGKETADWAQQTRLYWDVAVDDVLQEFGSTVPESITLVYTCGGGWWADGSGREARHEDGPSDEDVESGKAKPKLFRTDSTYGRLIALSVGKVGEWPNLDVMDDGDDVEVELVTLGKFLSEHRTPDPRDAKIWEGCQFEFRGLGRGWTNKQGQVMEARMKAYPVKFLGAVDVAATADAPAPDPGTPGLDQAWINAGADSGAVATLNALANAASSHTEFMKNAVLLPAVSGNEALLDVIGGQTNGPWS